MTNKEQNKRFENLTYNDFRQMASDRSLSKYEKIGFPNEYREGKEELIFNDICTKLSNIGKGNKRILDIGCGLSDLPKMLIDLAGRNNNSLFFIDSEEVLKMLPSADHLQKIPAFYPDCDDFINKNQQTMDVVIVYSVLHYIFVESNIYKFLDKTLSLLDHGGELLIGDIPNISKRKRFFSSPSGIAFHKNFMNTNESPTLEYNIIEEAKIDDSVIYSIIMRCRDHGFNAYILPQNEMLPMSNRREDILIVRP
jgi:SAM-dependent methyltransferase